MLIKGSLKALVFSLRPVYFLYYIRSFKRDTLKNGEEHGEKKTIVYAPYATQNMQQTALRSPGRGLYQQPT